MQRLQQARTLHRLRIGALLRLAQRKAVADAAKALAMAGTGPAQIELLAAVAGRSETDQRAVGVALGVDRTTITALVDAAEDRGWLVRSAGTDRRRKLLALTRAGRTMLDDDLPLLREASAATLAAAGPEGGRLPDLLHRLAAPAAALRDAPALLVDSPAFLLRRLAQLAAVLFAEAAGSAVLPGIDYSILLLLDQDLAETQADLLAALSTFRSSTMPALRRLEAGGLIERALVSSDRRRRSLRATPAGRARLRALDAPIAAYETAFLAPLTAHELAWFRDALSRLADEV